jgi:hypothetical protein
LEDAINAKKPRWFSGRASMIILDKEDDGETERKSMIEREIEGGNTETRGS